MRLPKNISKPFFSYGIFRPGEIAFRIISDFVDFNRIEKKTIKGSLILKDGVVFFDDKGDDSVEGYILFFKVGTEIQAYESMLNLDLGKRYIWCEDGPVSLRQFNILVEKKNLKMNLPKDPKKPFFTYGIFRPGEIAFQIISDYVDFNRIEKRTIEGSLKLRDGILIYDQKGGDEIQGYLLFFKEGMETEAYNSIVSLEPGNYYMWNEDQSKYRKEFNILHGKKIIKGIDVIQTTKSEEVVDEDKKLNNPIIWDYLFGSIWRDPFIINGFNMLDQYAKEEIILSKQYKEITWDDEGIFNDYLKYQMLYLFLCSILERMMFLNGGFGISPNKQIGLFSKDQTLTKVLDLIDNNDNFPNFKGSFPRVVHRADNPEVEVNWLLDGSLKVSPESAMKYYYQLRSNIIHRGKSGMHKYILLKESFEELKFILKTFWSEKGKESKKVKEEIDHLIAQRDERN